MGVRYTAPRELAAASDIITLHCPLTPQTRHIVNRDTLTRTKPGFMLVNTSRGALVDCEALIDGLKSGQIGAAALDVYEQEADFFFEDLSGEVIQDDVLQRLLTFPNVLLTGHQAFFTRDALTAIAGTTIASITAFDRGEPLVNRVAAERLKPAA
jgi:D-lactate dehydrogenase